jgi:shikimate O-hydroxycinnamoyltransferase
MVTFSFTSLCNFPIYEIDFGWGKPAWVTSASFTFNNLVSFFDTKSGDGIEAWINLKEEEMGKLENDEELLAYVSPNSFVLV